MPTLKPISTFSLSGSLVGGAAAHEVLSDGSDGSWVEGPNLLCSFEGLLQSPAEPVDSLQPVVLRARVSHNNELGAPLRVSLVLKSGSTTLCSGSAEAGSGAPQWVEVAMTSLERSLVATWSGLTLGAFLTPGGGLVALGAASRLMELELSFTAVATPPGGGSRSALTLLGAG
jgi:hypothetical protein